MIFKNDLRISGWWIGGFFMHAEQIGDIKNGISPACFGKRAFYRDFILRPVDVLWNKCEKESNDQDKHNCRGVEEFFIA